MERLQMPANIMERLRKNGISMSQSFNPEEYERQRAARANEVEGHLKDYDCPRCKNRGYFTVLKNGYMVSTECSCMEIRRSIQRGRDSGLGDLLRECTFDRFQTPDPWMVTALRLAQEYAENPQGWFVAAGVPGSGKTHLSTAICNRLISDGRAARYVLWKQESPKIKAAAMDAEKREKLLNPIIDVDVLYLDDFLKTADKSQPTKADIELAFEIISTRYNRKATTLLSTEFTAKELLAMDEAMGSRIVEMAGGRSFLSITGEGKNWRLRPNTTEKAASS